MTEATSAQARPKLLLVSSSGGHLKHLTATAAAWQDYDRVWVSFKQPDVESSLADEKTYWAYYPTTRNIKNAIRNVSNFSEGTSGCGGFRRCGCRGPVLYCGEAFPGKDPVHRVF